MPSRSPLRAALAALALLGAPAALHAQHPADVRFMQGMIGHHAQAVVMAALVPTHTQRPEMRMLAERIDVSQRDEIAMMRSWLERHHQPLPDSAGMMAGHAGHDMSHAAMPGMLNAAELDTLRAARGAAFDRLFLRYMIRHHEGALTMVRDLLAQPGAAQDSEVYRFASDVDTDQRAEIARMKALLDSYIPRTKAGAARGPAARPAPAPAGSSTPTPSHHHP
jgi:uncharacterized protein (DUF305 family)